MVGVRVSQSERQTEREKEKERERERDEKERKRENLSSQSIFRYSLKIINDKVTTLPLLESHIP